MGIFPAIWMVWVYTALLALIAVTCLVGALASRRVWSKGVLAGCTFIALAALGGAYLTGFTFRLNRPAPVSGDRLVYLVPNCLCNPDSNIRTDLDAVRVRDGHIQWRYPIRRSGLGPNDEFISDEQHVYVQQFSPDASHQGEDVITALDAQSGRQVWRVTSDFSGGLVSAVNGRLVVANSQTTLVLDANTGNELLREPAGNVSREQDGVLYACSGSNNVLTVTATEEASGHQLWTSPNVFGCGLVLTPQVLIATGQGTISGIRLADGALLWRANDGPGSSQPVVIGDTVFVSVPSQPLVAGNGVVNARRVGDGTLLWRKTMGRYPVLYGGATGIVLVSDSASSGAALVALRASDGQRLWSFPEWYDSPFVSTITGGVVLLGYASSRQIVALGLTTGSVYWQTTL